jgi:uncharacterized membrane protein
MFKLVVIAFNDLWQAEAVRLASLQNCNELLESALVVQRRLDNALTFNAIDKLSEKGLAQPTFWAALRTRIFMSPPLAMRSTYSSASIEALEELGITTSFVEKIAGELQPGRSLLMLLVEARLCSDVHALAREHAATSFDSDVANDDLEHLKRSVEAKIMNLTKNVHS